MVQLKIYSAEKHSGQSFFKYVVSCADHCDDHHGDDDSIGVEGPVAHCDDDRGDDDHGVGVGLVQGLIVLPFNRQIQARYQSSASAHASTPLENTFSHVCLWTNTFYKKNTFWQICL